MVLMLMLNSYGSVFGDNCRMDLAERGLRTKKVIAVALGKFLRRRNERVIRSLGTQTEIVRLL